MGQVFNGLFLMICYLALFVGLTVSASNAMTLMVALMFRLNLWVQGFFFYVSKEIHVC